MVLGSTGNQVALCRGVRLRRHAPLVSSGHFGGQDVEPNDTSGRLSGAYRSAEEVEE
jgi:hypothetical protein